MRRKSNVVRKTLTPTLSIFLLFFFVYFVLLFVINLGLSVFLVFLLNGCS